MTEWTMYDGKNKSLSILDIFALLTFEVKFKLSICLS